MVTDAWDTRVPRASGDEPTVKERKKQSGTEFPAQAGMNRENMIFHRFSSRVPRASGDEPPYCSADVLDDLSSPRKRG